MLEGDTAALGRKRTAGEWPFRPTWIEVALYVVTVVDCLEERLADVLVPRASLLWRWLGRRRALGRLRTLLAVIIEHLVYETERMNVVVLLKAWLEIRSWSDLGEVMFFIPLLDKQFEVQESPDYLSGHGCVLFLLEGLLALSPDPQTHLRPAPHLLKPFLRCASDTDLASSEVVLQLFAPYQLAF